VSSAAHSVSVPASPAQQRLWFINQLDKGAALAYHIGCAVRLSGELDLRALRKALNAVVERHEVLRARFAERQGTAFMVIAPPEPFALQVCDLIDETEVERHAGEESRAPFDLTTGPLIRGRLLRIGSLDHVLMVTMHHIVSDGWSLGIFIREAAALYAAFQYGRDNPLPPLRAQFRHYVQSQSERLTDEVLNAQMAYWREQLRGAPALLDLPLDRVRPAMQSYRGATREFRLDELLSVGLRRLGRRYGVTLYMVLYAGWAVMLSRLSGQDEVVIGAPVANRQSTSAEQMIGLFVNTLALRADLRSAPSVADFLARVKAMMLAAWSHQDTPFEQVVELLQPARTLRHNPIFQVLFVLQNTPQSELQLAGLRLTPFPLPAGTAQFDLSLSLQEAGTQIHGSLNYATDLFDGSTMERWIRYFTSVLTAMVTDPAQRVSEVELADQSS
jgi:hypothetical protein